MKVPTFKTLNFQDQVTSRFQDNVASVLSALAGAEILNYVIVKNIRLGTEDTAISHGLGRPAQGYLLIAASTATTPYTSPNDPGTSKTTLLLRGSVAAQVSFLIF